MPKKSKMVEYEIAMSDDEESIKVNMTEKKPARKKIERSEEAKQAMLKRLAEGREKAFKVRMENKANREKAKAEEQEKTEKVSTYLKHEDIFEKKYSSKFEKLEEILSGIDNNFREIKEYKKEKRERQAKKEKEAQSVSQPQEQEETAPQSTRTNAPMQVTHPLPPDLMPKGQDSFRTSTASEIAEKSVSCVDMVTMAKGLPNYSLMKFGRRKY